MKTPQYNHGSLPNHNTEVFSIPVALPEPAIEELKPFIRTEQSGRQVKKALAVKLIYQDYRYEDITTILDISKVIVI